MCRRWRSVPWRELINCRSQVIAKRTRAKNAARALLRGAGVTPPRHPGLWTKSGLAWLRQLELPTASQQLRRDLLLEEVEALTRQVRRIEHELNRRARQAPAVAQLRSIPGVGARTAEAVVAFVDDPERFANAKAVGRYLGLTPARTSRASATGSGISRARARRWSASCWPRPPGRRGAARRRSGRTSSGPGAATRSGRRSRWWPRRITWCG
jgi:transposase